MWLLRGSDFRVRDLLLWESDRRIMGVCLEFRAGHCTAGDAIGVLGSWGSL
jgi:hypothetical protein